MVAQAWGRQSGAFMVEPNLSTRFHPVYVGLQPNVVGQEHGRGRVFHADMAKHFNHPVVKPPCGVAVEYAVLVAKLHMAQKPLRVGDGGVAQSGLQPDVHGLGLNVWDSPPTARPPPIMATAQGQFEPTAFMATGIVGSTRRPTTSSKRPPFCHEVVVVVVEAGCFGTGPGVSINPRHA